MNLKFMLKNAIHTNFLWFIYLLKVCCICIVSASEKVDDGQHGIEIDWVKNASHCAIKNKWRMENISKMKPYSLCHTNRKDLRSWHVPIDTPIKIPNDTLPSSGAHREQWAVNGEYEFVPPGRFVHNVEHGGVAFLYHPCAPSALVDAFKNLARQCTWRHLIFAYPFVLNQTYPLGIVTFGCEYRMASINVTDIQLFLANRTKSGESLIKEGNYNYSLIQYSGPPEHNANSTEFCKNITNIWDQSALGGSNLQSTLSRAPAKTPRNKREAIWAVGSLAFLLIGLAAAVCYTQLWNKGNHGESFEEKSRVWNDESQPGSVSVAAIIRKFPNMLRSKMDRRQPSRISRDKRYHRIAEEGEDISEDEL